MLAIFTILHFLVDGVCATAMAAYAAGEPMLAPIVYYFGLYNAIAFGTQWLTGLLFDRKENWIRYAFLFVLVTLGAGTQTGLGIAAQTVLLGIGNSVFHVAAGSLVLRQYDTYREPGIFVCSGAVGLALGLNRFAGVYPFLFACGVLCAAATYRLWRMQIPETIQDRPVSGAALLGTEQPAVNGVSFEIEEGDYCAIVGANGSGKSTIARLIAGLFSPSSGSINFSQKISVGMVFQSPKDQIISGIVSRDTAFGPQNLKLPKSEIELRTIECLNIVDLLQKASSSSYSLSLGQTQKLAVSGILAIWPKMMILDESVAMLDPASRKSIFEFLRYWNRHGNTVLHITHDLDAIKESKRVIALDKGSLVFDGKTSDFLKNEKYVLNVTGQKLLEVDKKKAAEKIIKKETVFGFNNVFFCYENDDKSSVKNKASLIKSNYSF